MSAEHAPEHWPDDVVTSFEVAARAADQLAELLATEAASLADLAERVEGLRTYLANRAAR